MPMITLEYDNGKVQDSEIQQLSEAIQKIVSETTQIKDVFVYANSSHIKVKIAPIEIWVRMSAWKIKDLEELMNQVKTQLLEWKKQNNFAHPINLTIIPMQWKVEV
ncbi:MAG TPA: hypothetical protein VLI92_00165, partial [Candidatus Saccharimonadales bacterium]|nr:hypothetical protein [Candidatus Saccharimonadales bacterium]